MELKELLSGNKQEYYSKIDLDLYDSPLCQELATQASTKRHLKVLSQKPENKAIEIRLCED